MWIVHTAKGEQRNKNICYTRIHTQQRTRERERVIHVKEICVDELSTETERNKSDNQNKAKKEKERSNEREILCVCVITLSSHNSYSELIK